MSYTHTPLTHTLTQVTFTPNGSATHTLIVCDQTKSVCLRDNNLGRVHPNANLGDLHHAHQFKAGESAHLVGHTFVFTVTDITNHIVVAQCPSSGLRRRIDTFLEPIVFVETATVYVETAIETAKRTREYREDAMEDALHETRCNKRYCIT